MKRNTLLTMLLLVVALMLAACGGAAATPTAQPGTDTSTQPTAAVATEVMTEEPTATAEVMTDPGMMGGMGEMLGLEPVDPLSVEGDIIAAGSSTVFPLAQRMAERFQEEGYADKITIDSIGSGAGFERFCTAAETDISNASRAIKDEEIAACEGNNRNPIEIRVGTDAIAVVVNPDLPVDELSLEQLAQIFTGEITDWGDIDSAAAGVPVELYSPGTDSGTFDFFVEAVLDDDDSGILSAANIQFSEDDNVLVQGVEGSEGGIGYFGYAYYIENADKLKILTIDGVEPNEATAESNEYALSRPLFVYTADSILDEKPQVEAFLNFFLSHVDEEIIDVGYFPASDEALKKSADSLVNRTPVSAMMEEDNTGGEMAMEGGFGLAEVDPLAVEGDIIAAGSSTVFPLAQAMVEQFQEEGYAGDITIDSIGSGAGFERFCTAAETDISNASRAIKDEEIAACEANGREPLEFRIGTDAIAVVVNPDLPVDELSLEQLAQIFTGEITDWGDIDSAAAGIPVELYSPGTDSGTFDFFVEAVLDDDDSGILAAANIQFSEDDNVLVKGVEGSEGGIGYFGYAYYIENADKLKILTIDGVEPNEATAESNEYALSRPLFIYSAQSIFEEKPQVAEFISYFIQNVNNIIVEVGYFPASDEALQTAADTLTSAMP